MFFPGTDTVWEESASNLVLTEFDYLYGRGKSWATCALPSERHNEGSNCLFMDTHAKWHRQDQINEKHMNILWK